MRKNPCLSCWSSFPTRHESLIWGVIGIAASLILTALLLTQAG